jgi:phospholipid/cholesterol/gamma-HCH transport system ATP-binding protein
VIAVRHATVELAGRRVLQRVSLDLERREIVGLVGPPEAGKSILLKAVAGLVPWSAGELVVDGAPLALSDATATREWRGRIGMAFQNDALFDSLSVFDNVAFPLRRRGLTEEEVHVRVCRRLADVGLGDAGERLPSEISGGMCKRVGIARAAVIDPQVGLFDDPISGLDPVSSSRILDLIVELSRSLGSATVVVSNDLPVLLPIVHRVVMLWAGKVVYDGSVEGLVHSDRPEVVQFATGDDEGPL